MKRNASSMLPYIIAGSAVGGAIGYLFMTESGRRVRQSIRHPEDLPEKVEEAREFVEKKAQVVAGRVRDMLERAKQAMETGERAFREAEQSYRSQLRDLETKNTEIAATVHKTVDNLKTTAYRVEESILDPLYEAGALYRGIERGIRVFLGRHSQISSFYKSERVSG
jgi:vacuolar-type H+-ATPase subunit I/STV1